jgi:cell division protein FtsZ
MFELVHQEIAGANIKVIGCGGGGSNAVETMIRAGLHGVDFIVANTDRQALDASSATIKLQLGAQLTRGLGAGANPDVGRAAALEDRALIEEMVAGADMVFVTAGMGGGTGTGGAPVIAEVAREAGALTVAVVTKPFQFEGKRRLKHAEAGLKELSDQVDTLIVIPNQRLLYIASEKTSILETFKKADDVLLNAVKGITDLINIRGLINLDFADVRTVMSSRGLALMGTGVALGEKRAVEAATKAISSPLLEDISIKGATGIIINITGGPDLTLFEVNEASTLITEEADEEAEIIFGAVIDEQLKDEVRVTVIATGFKHKISQILSTVGTRPLTAHAHAASKPPAAVPVETPDEAVPSELGTQDVRHPSTPSPISIAKTESPLPTQPRQPVEEKLSDAVSRIAAEAGFDVGRTSQELPFETQGPPSPPFNLKATQGSSQVPSPPEPPVQAEVDEDLRSGGSSPPADVQPKESPKSASQPPSSREDDLKAARRIARELGIGHLGDEEYDIPTFLRRPADKDKDL